jgi:hypothetical protein
MDPLDLLKNKDLQIQVRKSYYDGLSSSEKVSLQKGAFSTTLCFCNKGHSKTSGTTHRHTGSKRHQECCLKLEKELVLNPGYLLMNGEFLYKNQWIQYYYFTTIDLLNEKSKKTV